MNGDTLAGYLAGMWEKMTPVVAGSRLLRKPGSTGNQSVPPSG